MAPWARSKFGASMFEPEVFRTQMYCIGESACDSVGTFWCPHNHSAPHAVFQHPRSDLAPVELLSLPPLVMPHWTTMQRVKGTDVIKQLATMWQKCIGHARLAQRTMTCCNYVIVRFLASYRLHGQRRGVLNYH